MMKPKLSRQRQWQVEARARGDCQSCGAPSQGRALCNRCSKRRGTKKRQLLKSVWAAVDWAMKPKHIAALLGVNVAAVYMQRRKRT